MALFSFTFCCLDDKMTLIEEIVDIVKDLAELILVGLTLKVLTVGIVWSLIFLGLILP